MLLWQEAVLFREMCHADENIESSVKREKAIAIIEKFIMPNSVLEVNLPSVIAKKLREDLGKFQQGYADVDGDYFNEAVTSILTLLQVSTMSWSLIHFC